MDIWRQSKKSRDVWSTQMLEHFISGLAVYPERREYLSIQLHYTPYSLSLYSLSLPPKTLLSFA